ncbi:MAG TPA: hypothetical protein PLV57_22200, partial [Phycisphaerae bacterium]|nr:hypothetical protein [Phycisphaerae bacterium]
DNPMSFWAGLSILATVAGIMAGHEEEPRLWQQAGWFLVAGLLLGFAYMVKETALILAAPMGLAFLFATRGLSLRRLILLAVAFGAGLATAGAIEAISLRMIAGEWFWRPGTSQGEAVTAAFRQRAAEQGWQFLPRLRAVANELRPHMDANALWLLVAIPAYPFLTPSKNGRRKAAVFVLAAFAWTLVYLTYGSASLKQYQPPTIRARYYALCVIPFSVIVAQAVVWASGLIAGIPWPRLLWRWTAALLVSGVLTLWASHLLAINYKRAGVNFRSQEVKTFLLALQDVRERYRSRPIVISQYLSQRMTPIIPDQVKGLSLTKTGNEYAQGQLPAGGFILIAPANPNRPDATLAAIKQAEAEGKLRLEPAGRGTYAAPLGRLNELRYYLYPLFSSAAPPEYVSAPWAGMMAYLVSPTGNPSPRSTGTAPAARAAHP